MKVEVEGSQKLLQNYYFDKITKLEKFVEMRFIIRIILMLFVLFYIF